MRKIWPLEMLCEFDILSGFCSNFFINFLGWVFSLTWIHKIQMNIFRNESILCMKTIDIPLCMTLQENTHLSLEHVFRNACTFSKHYTTITCWCCIQTELEIGHAWKMESKSEVMWDIRDLYIRWDDLRKSLIFTISLSKQNWYMFRQ